MYIFVILNEGFVYLISKLKNKLFHFIYYNMFNIFMLINGHLYSFKVTYMVTQR